MFGVWQLYVYTDDVAIVQTHFPLNFSSWFVLGGKKQITAHLFARCDNIQQQLHFQFCMFLWSDCYTVFTVLLETQKLYLLSISRWSVHKMPWKKIRKLTFKKTLIKYKALLLFDFEKSILIMFGENHLLPSVHTFMKMKKLLFKDRFALLSLYSDQCSQMKFSKIRVNNFKKSVFQQILVDFFWYGYQIKKFYKF